MKRKLTRTQKFILTTIIIVLFIGLLTYLGYLGFRLFQKEAFVNQSAQIAELNRNPVFKIKKIQLYHSADAIDDTAEHSLKDLDISQYTDIAIFIDNTSYIQELNAENTVKALRIDNIEIHSDQESGMKSLTYKSPLDFAKFKIEDSVKEIYNSKDSVIKCAPIDYEIIYKNDGTPDFSTPRFYTDCSDAITLGFLNRNVVSNYSVPDNNNVSFNGTLLKLANVDLTALSSVLTFNINITNNADEHFVYEVKLNLSFDEQSGITTNGYSYQERVSPEGNTYNFVKCL